MCSPISSTPRSGTRPRAASLSIGRLCSRAIRRPSIGPAATSTSNSSKRYPDAKVILTVRDPERWYESARQTIYYVRHAFPSWTRLLIPRMRRFIRMLDRLIWDGMFHDRFEDKPFAIDVFNRFNEQVRHTVPAERLLVYEVQEGWGPLCAFLGVPVPEGKPFPHLNDTVEFRSRIQRTARILRTVGYAVVAALTVILAWLASKFIW